MIKCFSWIRTLGHRNEFAGEDFLDFPRFASAHCTCNSSSQSVDRKLLQWIQATFLIKASQINVGKEGRIFEKDWMWRIWMCFGNGKQRNSDSWCMSNLTEQINVGSGKNIKT